jgi:hydroxyethylthiazole kinase-like uncharacterized protein yjeF
MEILTGSQMRDVDRYAIEKSGIPSLDLMEAAGAGVSAALSRSFPDLAERGILILCGKGNNGGDGFVAARHLRRRGLCPAVILFAEPASLGGDAAVNYAAALQAGVRVSSITDAARLADLTPYLESGPVVLDCMLGTGIKGGVRGLLGAVIQWINGSGAEVVAVDLPSGLDGDSGLVQGEPLRATRTYTLCRPKLPLVCDPAAALAGTWEVIAIGIPDEAVRAVEPNLLWLDDTVAGLLPPRPLTGHKGTFGHLLAVSGCRGKGGASVLLGRAALRTGAGLCTLAVPSQVRAEVAIQQPELMTEPLSEDVDGRMNLDATRTVLKLAEGKQALAIGPGLGSGGELSEAVSSLVVDCPLPLVLDADGLNALALAGDGPASLRQRATPAVLTPHPREAARLLGTDVPAIQADRLAAAQDLARQSASIVVLKGRNTVVARPDGRAAFNSTGNPGMATAGTGDALTGMIGALLALKLEPWDAATLGVYLHGRAGDMAAACKGEDGMIASDLISNIPDAIRNMRESEKTR